MTTNNHNHNHNRNDNYTQTSTTNTHTHTYIYQSLKLKSHLELIQSESSSQCDHGNGTEKHPLKSMVNVGCDVYMKARITQPDKVIVNVGLNYYVEFTIPEAISYIDAKEKYLQKLGDVHTDKAAEIKAQIKFVLNAIDELIQSSIPQKKKKTST
jgi:prefoldin alpha subunit